MKKMLIVDDEENIRTLVAKYAALENYEVSEAANGLEALKLAKENDYDIIIMDIMMPELDGFTASREIKKLKDVPIILLSARGEEYDRINGFEAGAEDYVVKPFSPKELMLRVGAILRRTESGRDAEKKSGEDCFRVRGLEVDMAARIVRIDGKRVEMSPKEYALLFYMIKNKGIALSREKFLCDVWGYDFYGDDRTLDTHIKLLRKSLGEYGDMIVTLRGIGYRFDTEAVM